MSTRTVETEIKYQKQMASLQKKVGFCPFHDDDKKEPIERFDHWVMFQNEYPYKWAEEHYLLFPKRHTNKLNPDEQQELAVIIKDMDNMHYVCLKNHRALTSVWCLHYHIIKPYIPNENN